MSVCVSIFLENTAKNRQEMYLCRVMSVCVSIFLENTAKNIQAGNVPLVGWVMSVCVTIFGTSGKSSHSDRFSTIGLFILIV